MHGVIWTDAYVNLLSKNREKMYTEVGDSIFYTYLFGVELISLLVHRKAVWTAFIKM